MAGNPQVLELLEEMLESGKTPDEVCSECPELLAEVRERSWSQIPMGRYGGALCSDPGQSRAGREESDHEQHRRDRP